MTGPCLCGDPFCGSCGDPGAAKLEEWSIAFTDKLIELGITEEEAVMLDSLVPQLIEHHRNAVKRVVAEVRAENAEYISHLEDKCNCM